ncbi:unnamed protein product [Malus baccata var. baccata]
MASFCLNSLPLPPPSQPRKLSESPPPPPSNSLNVNNYGSRGEPSKPIVISGSPPTFVSAPGRRIVADVRDHLSAAGVIFEDDDIVILALKGLPSEYNTFRTVNGNHETINVEGDFRFVDTGGFDECLDFLEYLDDNRDDWEEAFVGWVGVSTRMKEERKTPQNYWDPWNLVREAGGPLACELARHAVVLKVNDWVFCHGGLVPQHVAYGVERMNREVSDWMRGLVESDDNPRFPFIATIATKGCDGVVWNRMSVLEIKDNKARVIRSKKDPSSELMLIWLY